MGWWLRVWPAEVFSKKSEGQDGRRPYHSSWISDLQAGLGEITCSPHPRLWSPHL